MPLKGLAGPFLDVLRGAGLSPFFPDRHRQLTEEDLLEVLSGCTATLAGSEPYTRRVIEAVPTLRVIARAGVGYDAVDVTAATEHGIVVATTPGANQESAAEHTFALMLALAKEIVSADRAVKAGAWPRRSTRPLRGRTLGIVGLGRIGKAVALRAAAFGMERLAAEPVPDLAFMERHRITLVPLDRLLAESDFVTLHVPLTAQTRRMIDRRALERMKPTAFLINTSRGGVVCEEDLVEALGAGRIAGAGLDVFQHEPLGEHALGKLDHVVLTPHTAGIDLQARDEMALRAARAIVEVLKGGWPAEQVINPEVRTRPGASDPSARVGER